MRTCPSRRQAPAPAVRDAITELSNWDGLEALAGMVAVLQRGMLLDRGSSATVSV
jgi:hypothetical protein